jgi:dipeptidyl aminopeptidase/acylaminoacyl peptidase
MRFVSFFSVFLTLTVTVQPVTAQLKRAITPEDLVDIRSVSDPAISPDGKRIAFVVSEPRDASRPQLPRARHIWMVPVDGSEPARQLAASARSENSPRWSPDGRSLAFLSNRGEDNQQQVWLVHADGSEPEKLTSARVGVQSFRWSPDGRMIAFLARDGRTEEEQKKQELRDDAIHVDRDYKPTRLWVIGLSDRKTALVTRQDTDVADFDWSPDSASFAVAFNPDPSGEGLSDRLGIVRRADGQLVRNLADNVWSFAPNVRWSPDGSAVLFFESWPAKGSTWPSLVSSGGGPLRPLLKTYPGTAWVCEWAADTRHIVAEAAVGTGAKLLRIDAGTGEASAVADLLIEFDGGTFSVNADGHAIAFVAEKADSPPDVWALTADQRPRQLTNFNPQVALLRLGAVRDISWTSRKDGQMLHGVLVTPADFKTGQPYPMIVEAHPGVTPWWLGWQGSWWQWAQLLASNGYVVFLPNVRGVMSQGWEFGGIAETWTPGIPFDQTMDGVDSLIEQKIADPNRLGIGGWSNGGLMTAWAITHTNRFRAAAPFAAIIDFQVQWGDVTGNVKWGMGLEENVFGGTPMSARQRYEANSALYSVQNCKTPTLILHGAADTTVPVSQAYMFYRALKALGVETEMVVYPREGHNLVERAHQIDIQTRVLAWFDRHLK